MRDAAIFLISAITVVVAVEVQLNNKGCPKDHTIEKVLPHEDCNSFYLCIRGDLVTHRCPGNLQFDVESQKCDWPNRVKCFNKNTDIKNLQTVGVVDPTNCGVEGSDGALLANEYCNKFYKCSGGRLITFWCPSNLLFNPNSKVCDWPINVECGSRIIPGSNNDNSNGDENNNLEENEVNTDNNNSGSDSDNTENDNLSETSSICADEGSNGFLVVHQYCNKFYKCSGGLPVVFQCPANLLFNPRNKVCDWPNNVDCGDRIVPDGDDENNGGDDGGDDSAGDDGGNGDNDNDVSDETNNEVNDDPSEAPTICASDGSDGVLVAHEYCNKFYKCAGGLPVAFRCPANLLFNPNINKCDWPKNVNCGDRIIPDGDDNNGGDDGDDDSSSEDGGNGDNDNGGSGENDNEVNDDPNEAPSICASEGSDGVLVAHEYCNKFYKCAGGFPVAFRCPANLLFNPNINKCDWPKNVDCGNRIIPDDDDENGGGGNGGEESEEEDGGNGDSDNDSSDENSNEGDDNDDNGSGDDSENDSNEDGDNNDNDNGDSGDNHPSIRRRKMSVIVKVFVGLKKFK